MSTSEAHTPEKFGSVSHTGAVYTPKGIASELLRLSMSLSRVVFPQVLEPSVGDGVFVDAMLSSKMAGELTLVDINEKVIRELEDRYHGSEFVKDVLCDDFIKFSASRIAQELRYDIIIGNPPFIRRRNFSSDHMSYISKLAALSGVPVAQFKNSWAAFLIAAVMLLSERGVACFVLPYELLTVNYGRYILRWLSENLHRVDVFISRSKAFKNIDQDAVAIVCRKAPDGADSGIFINYVEALDSIAGYREVSVDLDGQHSALSFNGHLIEAATVMALAQARSVLKSISDYCRTAPGVVTAANDFFIVSSDMAHRRRIFGSTLPILRKSFRELKGAVLTEELFNDLALRYPSRLIAIPAGKVLGPCLSSYISEGEAQGLDLRYKCRKRDAWYSVPVVPSAPCFIFKRSHSHPRIIINEACVHTTDSAYGIYLDAGVDTKSFCVSFYNSLTLLYAEISGRFYGGGVLELSPTELRSLPLPYVHISAEEFVEFNSRYGRADSNLEALLDFVDELLAKRAIISASDLSEARRSWRAVREHRLRHSGVA